MLAVDLWLLYWHIGCGVDLSILDSIWIKHDNYNSCVWLVSLIFLSLIGVALVG